MNLNRFLLSINLIGVLFAGQSQPESLRVSGTVMDVTTEEPIPFVSIGSLGSTLGTSSNEEGEFLLKIDSFPVRIVFSHLNYQKRLIEIKSSGSIGSIQLKPIENSLDEITISEKKRGNEGIRLLTEAYNKARQGANKEYYGKAFYRQKTKEDEDDYYELYEIFFDAMFSTQGITDWAIQEGRYALKDDLGSNYLFNRNFTLFGRILYMFQPNTDDYIIPVNPQVENLYDVKIERLLKMGSREVAVIDCQIKEDIKTPAMNGKVYIDINNYDILKIAGEIRNDNLSLVKLTQKGTWTHYVLSYEIAYKADIDSALLLDYISVGQSFDYSPDNSTISQPVETSALMTFYDYYHPAKGKRLGGRIRRKESDADILNQIGYNKTFWEDNPIVKRTPVEEDVIQSFESQEAFGTIYLNDRELVVLEKDNLEDNPVVMDLLSKLRRSATLLDQEKAYLHFDKDFYTAGEVMWFKAYLLDAIRHLPLRVTSLLYVELLGPDSELIIRKKVKIEAGWGLGEIELPDHLSNGNYVVRAYTPWMQNFSREFFFTRNFNIYNSSEPLETKEVKKDKIDLQFFPEGGELIGGLITQVAYKAINSSGQGVPFEGKILNSNNETVANLRSNHLGMGTTFFMPKPGDQLVAVIDQPSSSEKYALPEIKDSGISISVRYLNGKAIKVALRATPDYEGQKFYLLGQSKGVIYHKESIVIQRGQALVDIPEAKFPRGILQLTLFDEEGHPQLERLVFLMNELGSEVSLKVDDSKLKARQLIAVDLEVTNNYGRQLNAELSVSVTDYDQIKKEKYGNNISNYLLLRSELKGKIEEPGYYFKDEERQTLQDLDVLMLTQGWRRFDWETIIKKQTIKPTIQRGSGFEYSGTVVSTESDQPLPFHSVSMYSENFRQSFRTDENGKFTIYNPTIQGNTEVIASIESPKGNVINARIDFNSDKNIPMDAVSSQYFNDFIPQLQIGDYLKADQIRKEIEASYGTEVTLLSEIVVEEDQESLSDELYNSRIYGQAYISIQADDVIRSYPNVLQMIVGRGGGIRLTNDGIRIRGARQDPLVLVDGVPVNSDRGGLGFDDVSLPVDTLAAGSLQGSGGNQYSLGAVGNNLISQLSNIQSADVNKIDIISGPGASSFGLRGGSGVIAIYTRRGESYQDADSNISSITVSGYDVPRIFYQPKYGGEDANSAKPDKRVTLYWEPHLNTSKNGKAQFSFYNSDNAKNLEIVVEGISEDGTPVNFRYHTSE